MNQLHIVLTGIVSLAIGFAAIGIVNAVYAQDAENKSMNWTGGNATTTVGSLNMTGANETLIDDNATGNISCRRC